MLVPPCLLEQPTCGVGSSTMIRSIMTKRFFLRRPCVEATEDDLAIAQDLADTLAAHREGCVGMAANMIGQRKRIIAVTDERDCVLVMLNPRITDCSGPYESEEGCLSLPGVRRTHRFERIAVTWQDMSMKPQTGRFSGRVAQAIQHELDHCDGILV